MRASKNRRTPHTSQRDIPRQRSASLGSTTGTESAPPPPPSHTLHRYPPSTSGVKFISENPINGGGAGSTCGNVKEQTVYPNCFVGGSINNNSKTELTKNVDLTGLGNAAQENALTQGKSGSLVNTTAAVVNEYSTTPNGYMMSQKMNRPPQKLSYLTNDSISQKDGINYNAQLQQPSTLVNEDWSLKQRSHTSSISGMAWRRLVTHRPDLQNSTIHETITAPPPLLGGNGEQRFMTAQTEFRDAPPERFNRGRRRNSGSSGGHRSQNLAYRSQQQIGLMHNTKVSSPSREALERANSVSNMKWNNKDVNANTLSFDSYPVLQWLHLRATACINEYRLQQNRKFGGCAMSPQNVDANKNTFRLIDISPSSTIVQPTTDDFLQLFQQALYDLSMNTTNELSWQYQQQRQQQRFPVTYIYQGQQQFSTAVPTYSIVTDGVFYYEAPPPPQSTHPQFDLISFQQQQANSQQMMFLMSNPNATVPAGGIPVALPPTAGPTPTVLPDDIRPITDH